MSSQQLLIPERFRHKKDRLSAARRLAERHERTCPELGAAGWPEDLCVAELAREVGYGWQYLADVLAGRKPGGFKLHKKIVGALELDWGEYLAIVERRTARNEKEEVA
jgi:hypothetical protein